MKVMNEGPVGFNGEQGQTQLATLIKWAAEQWVLSHWNHFWGLVATFTCQSGWTWWIGGTQEAGRANQLISHLSSLLKEDYTFTVLHRVRLQKWECKCKAGSLCWLCRIYGKCKQWHVSLVETDSCVCLPCQRRRVDATLSLSSYCWLLWSLLTSSIPHRCACSLLRHIPYHSH